MEADHHLSTESRRLISQPAGLEGKLDGDDQV